MAEHYTEDGMLKPEFVNEVQRWVSLLQASEVTIDKIDEMKVIRVVSPIITPQDSGQVFIFLPAPYWDFFEQNWDEIKAKYISLSGDKC